MTGLPLRLLGFGDKGLGFVFRGPHPKLPPKLMQERALCATARLLPSQYLAYKASFLREAQRRGGGFPRAEARSMFRLEGATSLSVYDLLTSCGWLQPSEPGTEAGEF